MFLRTMIAVACLLSLPVVAEAAPPVRAPRPLKHRLKLTRPVSKPPLKNPTLKEVLDAWGNASADLKVAELKFSKFVYDLVFFVEVRGVGTIHIEPPTKFTFDIQPAVLRKGQKSKRVASNTKRPFSLRTSYAEKWINDGKSLIQIEASGKRTDYSLAEMEQSGWRIQPIPPFVAGISSASLRRKCDWKILRDTGTEIWLQGMPRTKSSAAIFRECKVIVDKGTWLAMAIQFVDRPGSRETVYVYYDWKIAVRK